MAASVRYYGLDLPDILEARQGVMRDVNDRVDVLLKSIEVANAHEAAADDMPVEEQRQAITALTLPNSPFALAARAKLIELGLSRLLADPEDYPALAA